MDKLEVSINSYYLESTEQQLLSSDLWICKNVLRVILRKYGKVLEGFYSFGRSGGVLGNLFPIFGLNYPSAYLLHH